MDRKILIVAFNQNEIVFIAQIILRCADSNNCRVHGLIVDTSLRGLLKHMAGPTEAKIYWGGTRNAN